MTGLGQGSFQVGYRCYRHVAYQTAKAGQKTDVVKKHRETVGSANKNSFLVVAGQGENGVIQLC